MKSARRVLTYVATKNGIKATREDSRAHCSVECASVRWLESEESKVGRKRIEAMAEKLKLDPAGPIVFTGPFQKSQTIHQGTNISPNRITTKVR